MTETREPLFLTARGLATAIGVGKDAVAPRLFDAPATGLVASDAWIPGRTTWIGSVTAALPTLPPGLGALDCRNNRLAALILDEIAGDIAAARERYGPARIAVLVGTSTSGIAEGEVALAARFRDGAWPRGFRYARQEPGNLATAVAALAGVSGPAYTICTACSSSGKAFASAERLIRAGFCDAAIVGGIDTLCRLTLNGFSALEALSARPCNPLSRNRDGTSIGEGGALFLMEKRPGPVAFLAAGESSDAYHVSAPEPGGAGARLAIERALAAAGLTADDIGYVNLHGTGTVLNDIAESAAVAAVLGTDVPCSSTKGLTGHALGAASAIEAAFLWLALHPRFGRGRLPPHLWDGDRDPSLPALALAAPGDALAPGRGRAMLSSSFAFGGSNVALVLGEGRQ